MYVCEDGFGRRTMIDEAKTCMSQLSAEVSYGFGLVYLAQSVSCWKQTFLPFFLMAFTVGMT